MNMNVRYSKGMSGKLELSIYSDEYSDGYSDGSTAMLATKAGIEECVRMNFIGGCSTSNQLGVQCF